MARKLLLLCMLVLLAACQNKKPEPPREVIVTVTQLVPYECGKAPNSDAVATTKVQWQTVADATGKVWYALSPDHYRNLMTNIANMITGGKQLKGQRDFYVKCLERSRAAAEKSNQEARDAAAPSVP